MSIESTDRYEALGMPYPDPGTMCKGECEGTGWYPQNWDDPTITEYEQAAWLDAHNAEGAHTERRRVLFFFYRTVRVPCDGSHFIRCADCGGTGKAI